MLYILFNMAMQFEIPLTNGEVSSILTTLEFLAGTVALYCVHILLLAYWIRRIHSSMNGRQSSGLGLNLVRHRRSFRKREIFGLAIAGLCTVFVALTEANLGSTSRISKRTKLSTVCSSVQNPYQTDLLQLAAPPLSFKVRAEAIKLAGSMDCYAGFDLMDFGSDNFILTESPSFYIPTCVQPSNISLTTNEVLASNLREAKTELKTSNLRDEMITLSENIFYIIPYEKPELVSTSRKQNRNGEPLPPIPQCEQKSISSLTTMAQYEWGIRKVDDLNISRLVTSKICEQHEIKDNSVVVINSKDAKTCFSNDGTIDNNCLRSKSRPGTDRFTATIENSVALITHDIDGEFSHSHACTNATVEYEYVLVSENDLFLSVDKPAIASTSKAVIIPTAIRVAKGRCEPTFHALALSSLIYAARVHWYYARVDPSLKALNEHQCYWAFFISIARLYFPYDAIENNINTPANCTLHVSREATVIEIDWYFIVMAIIFVVYSVVVCVTIFFWSSLTKQDMEFARVADTIAAASSDNVSIGSVTIRDRKSRKVTRIVTQEVDDPDSDSTGFAEESDEDLIIECEQRPSSIVGNEVGLRGTSLFRPRNSVVNAYTLRSRRREGSSALYGPVDGLDQDDEIV